MAMNMNKLTEKAQEAIVAAQRLAEERHHTQLEPEHLLLRARRPGGRRRAGRARAARASQPRSVLERLEPALGWLRAWLTARRRSTSRNRFRRVFEARGPEAERLKDDYVSTEHFLLALADDAETGAAGQTLRRLGRHPRPAVPGAAGGPRRPARHQSQNPETTYQSLEKYGRDLTALARAGQARPGHRPRRGDPPRRSRCSQPPDQEQPGADRRAGRRQDGHRRGPGPAHRPRRRARGPEGQADRRARPRRAGRRRQVPRRVRGAAQGRPQGGHRLGRRRSSCSSTSCTRSSARARPRASMDASNMLKPMLARGELHCIGATTLDEYRKHIEKDAALERRFQPVFVGEPTVEDTISHPARPARALRAAPQGPDQGLRAGRGGRPLAPLHRRPLPARQGDRPGRRGRRQAAHGSDQHAGRARRGPPPDHAARDRARGPAQGEGQGVEGAARASSSRSSPT